MTNSRRRRFGSLLGILCLLCGMALVCLSAILLTGCSRGGNLYAYTESGGRYRVRFPSPAGDVVCLLEGDSETQTLTVLSPTRSESVTVVFTADRCTLSAGGSTIVLSPDASAELRAMTTLLYRGEAGASVRREGDDTLICYDDGTVTLGADLTPRALTLGTWTVTVESLSDEGTDKTQNTNG